MLLPKTIANREKQKIKILTNLPKKRHAFIWRIDEEIPWGELIEAVESDESYEKRKGDKSGATHELDIIGMFKSRIEQPTETHKGKLPRKEINDAIDAITLVIMKKLSGKAKETASLHDIETGDLKDGFSTFANAQRLSRVHRYAVWDELPNR